LKEQYSEKKAVGRPRKQYLKQVTRNTGADTQQRKEWLATFPDGKLPTNQILKDKKMIQKILCQIKFSLRLQEFLHTSLSNYLRITEAVVTSITVMKIK
jgi:hypothetical protein